MNNKSIKFIWSYIKEYKSKLILVVISIFIYTTTKLIGPFLLGYITDNYISVPDIPGLLKMCLVLLCIYLVSSFAGWLQNYINADMAAKTINSMRNSLFRKIESLSMNFFDSKPHGEIMSRFTNDIDNINQILTNSLTKALSNLLQLVGVIIFMLFLDVKLALITIIISPIVVLIGVYLSKKSKALYNVQQEKLERLNHYIEEEISGLKVIKAYGLEKESIRKFHKENTSLKETSIKAQFISSLLIPIMSGLNNVTLVIIVITGGYLTLKGEASVGLILTFITFARLFFQPINQLSNIYNQLQLAFVGCERVMEIMTLDPTIKDSENSKDIKVLNGYVKLKSVSFGYTDKLVLKDINIEAFKGQKIALVGPTGSGKTSIINLLNRFYDLNSGEIYFDELEIRNIKVSSLRKRIGIVLQDTVLFSGTVKENLLFGKNSATDDEIEGACIQANIHDYIITMPKGYDTEINNETTIFSKGQKQLLSIARTILSNPDILILDEATSNVDTMTESKIQEAMNNMMSNRTSFIIAHRLKTIIGSDKIIVLKDGNIIEEGTHKELLSKGGLYFQLYENQFSLNNGVVNE